MPAELNLSTAAADDLQNIFNYGFQQHGERVAEAYRDGLRQHLQTLREFPEAYAEDNSLSPPGRVAPYKSHVVLYRYSNDAVFIGRIRHHSEDWRKTTSGNS